VQRYDADMYWDLNKAAWVRAGAEPAQPAEQHLDEHPASEPEPLPELELT
jgi:hypothetical protein